MADGIPKNLQSTFDDAWTTTRPLGQGPPPGFSGPSQTPITPMPVLQGVGMTTAIPEGDAGPNRAHEARAADAAAMPPPPPPRSSTAAQPGGGGAQLGATVAQPGGMGTQPERAVAQGGAPPRAVVQDPEQQVIMTRQEVQQMVAEAAAQVVQQVTN
ncbi:Unknown protein, partial [Striga hermonthica]